MLSRSSVQRTLYQNATESYFWRLLYIYIYQGVILHSIYWFDPYFKMADKEKKTNAHVLAKTRFGSFLAERVVSAAISSKKNPSVSRTLP